MTSTTVSNGRARGVCFDDPKRFYELVRPALERQEIESSLLLGVARRLADDGGAAFMLALEADEGVEAAALRLKPHQLSICCRDESAIERLVDAVLDTGEPVPAVIGLETFATRFAERWIARTGQILRPGLALRLYTLTRVLPPFAPAPGRLRLASAQEEDWLTDWHVAFAHEAGLPEVERNREHSQSMVRGRLAQARQFVWDDGGKAVAILGFSPAGINGARIGGVMTAPTERRKGYASAAVAALSQNLLGSGRSWCGLFADVANPQSNRIYRRLGYTEACRFQSIGLASSQDHDPA